MKIYIEYDEDVAKDYGFELTQKSAVVLANGMIEVCLDWTSTKDQTKFKYPSLSHYGYNSNSVDYAIEFNNVTYKDEELDFTSTFNISIGLVCDKAFEPLFHQNTKYGCLVYFAPEGWNLEDENNKVAIEVE